MKSETGLGGTLRNIRVLDLTRNFAGPYCTMTLGDMGAEVIKIERIGRGDDTRNWSPPTWEGISTTFLSANRNKQSIALDINKPEGLKIVADLASKVDVLVESFRPGSLEKRGLGYETLKELNPSLIYCSISGYGNAGPLQNSPGYDPIVQASSGIMDMTGEPDQEPVRLPIAVNDMGAGLWAVIGILSALRLRDSTGQGSKVDTSLYETAAWWMNYHITGYLATENSPTRCGTGTPWIVPYEVYPAADEGLLVCAGNDLLFTSFMEELELSELIKDERFTTNPQRVINRVELRRLIIERFETRTAGEWKERLLERSIPCSLVRNVSDLVQDEQLEDLKILSAYPHPLIPDLRLINIPLSINGERSGNQISPPLLGAQTELILEQLGYSKKLINNLRTKGIVG